MHAHKVWLKTELKAKPVVKWSQLRCLPGSVCKQSRTSLWNRFEYQQVDLRFQRRCRMSWKKWQTGQTECCFLLSTVGSSAFIWSPPLPQAEAARPCGLASAALGSALTFELQVLHGALGQRAEGVAGVIRRWVEDVGLPLLEDVLQQLVQHVTCGGGGCKRSKVTRCRRVCRGNFGVCVTPRVRIPPPPLLLLLPLSALQAAGSLSNNGKQTAARQRGGGNSAWLFSAQHHLDGCR